MSEPMSETFEEWLESIAFVDVEGAIVPLEIGEDESPDPDGDREE